MAYYDEDAPVPANPLDEIEKGLTVQLERAKKECESARHTLGVYEKVARACEAGLKELRVSRDLQKVSEKVEAFDR